MNASGKFGVRGPTARLLAGLLFLVVFVGAFTVVATCHALAQGPGLSAHRCATPGGDDGSQAVHHDCDCCVPRRLYKMELLLPILTVAILLLEPSPSASWTLAWRLDDAPPPRPGGALRSWSSRGPPIFS